MSAIRPEFVHFIPKSLSPGVLYISERYRTASHLCACGCGEKVVTPLSPADWQLTREGERVSLHPSIGNWDYACHSHYSIKRNEIVWSASLSAARIARIQDRDRRDKVQHVQDRNRARLAQTPARAHAQQSQPTDPARAPWWDRLAVWIARLFDA